MLVDQTVRMDTLPIKKYSEAYLGCCAGGGANLARVAVPVNFWHFPSALLGFSVVPIFSSAICSSIPSMADSIEHAIRIE